MYCKLKNAVFNKEKQTFEPSVPIIGLTATASFDVLSDVQRELEIGDEGVLRSQGMDRPELQYKVIETPLSEEAVDNPMNASSVRKGLGETKQSKLIDLLSKIPTEFTDQYEFFNKNGECKNAGLIFCPHKNWVFGVNSVADKIGSEFPGLRIGTYMGSSGDDWQNNPEENVSEI